MAEIEELADIPLVTGDIADTRANLRHAAEELLPEERVRADRLITQLVTAVQKLNFLKKPVAREIADRLIEKLQMANLGEDSVGVIAERVWWRLMGVSGLGESTPPDGLDKNCSGSEVVIAENILHRVEGKAFFLIKDAWEDIVKAAGPDVSSRVIRTVAREAWPKVRESLKV